ncbi:outer membrane beta-barrel protein [Flavobacterium sp. Sd200]|uniref:porin family protein n=1 Tax=Flavobacterium sp. Sd200 TaxID=2692211 RepID=UPI00136D6F62|nr:porin family protein [Flavobacterium sp. Sd200]MXN92076.1 outer membrane beta-barrel protein [Flavobacterium sp. Sd200]
MHFFKYALLLFFTLSLHAQVEQDTIKIVKDSLAPIADPKYREDQFYATITYNLMEGQPRGYAQYSFSTGISGGFLRDMPVNKRRNHSIAVGLGYSYNNIKHNLVVAKTDVGNFYSIQSNNTFDRNKLVLHYAELPIEFRWRNSDSISHQFWRIYLGFKASYLFYSKAQLKDGGNDIKVINDANLNKFVLGSYISAGWNTWNLYAYYGFTPIYKDAVLDGQKLNMHMLKLGLIFYIL